MREIVNRVWNGSKVMAMYSQVTAGGIAIIGRLKEVILTKFWSTKFSLSIDFQIYGTRVT